MNVLTRFVRRTVPVCKFLKQSRLIQPRSQLQVATPSLILPLTRFVSTTVNMSSANNVVKLINYEDLKKVIDDNQTLLIDVREPDEIKSVGQLPASINIPLGEVEKVLKTVDKNQFAELYGRIKPSLNSPIVFSCHAGRRGGAAAEIALKLGYKNISNYIGGYSDWEKQSKGS